MSNNKSQHSAVSYIMLIGGCFFMTSRVLMALVATLCTWGLTALGAAAVVFFRSPNGKIMNFCLGFAAGVMIAASFWSLLSPAIERVEMQGGAVPPYAVAAAGFLTGAVFMWASDKIVSRARIRAEESRGVRENRSRMAMLMLSITLHNIPEGLAVGVAFGTLASVADTESIMGAVTLAMGIGLQNFPEGAAVSLPMRREGCSRARSFFYGQVSGMVEPIAGVLGALLVVCVEAVLPFALSFAAGAMILVAVHELIPECQRNTEELPYFATMGIILGFTVMMMLDVMLG